MQKLFYGLAGLIVLLPIAGEVVVRQAGLIDVPLYDADNRIGYIPKPNQHGSFLNGNDWTFNELSMGTARPFQTTDGTDVLLVGDSIVMGGNRYRQTERLGPQLEQATGAAVWPIGAASWRLQNEFHYLADHPQVVAAVDRIVFVVNSNDFAGVSSWRTEMVHPRHPPVSALAHFLQKQLFEADVPIQPEMKVPDGDAYADLKRLSPSFGRSFDVWLFPSRAESLDATLRNEHFGPERARLEALGIPGMRIFDAAAVLGLTEDDYTDRSHPTPTATRKFAHAIADALKAGGCLVTTGCRQVSSNEAMASTGSAR
jgi:hypothetical protein